MGCGLTLLFPPVSVCCGPGLLLCCGSGQLQLLLFCPGVDLGHRGAEDFRCFVLSNQRRVNGWEDNHGHCTALKVTVGVLCDKYIYFSLDRLWDLSLTLAFHHPWGDAGNWRSLSSLWVWGVCCRHGAASASRSCPDLLLLLFVRLTNTEAGALPWDATRERKPEVSELVGCSAEHIQTFVHHVSPRLAGWGSILEIFFSWGWVPYVPVPLLSWAPCPRADSFQCSRFCLPFLPSEHTQYKQSNS